MSRDEASISPSRSRTSGFTAGPASKLWSHSRLVEINKQGLAAEVRAYDEIGRLILEINGLRCQYVGVDGGRAESLDELLYEFQWQLQPRADATEAIAERRVGFMPPLREVATHVLHEFEKSAVLAEKTRYAGLEAAMNRLCASYVAEAIKQLGGDLTPGLTFSGDSLARQLGIIDQHRRLFPRYLAMLAEDGALRPISHPIGLNGTLPEEEPTHADAGWWEVVALPDYEPSNQIWLDLLMRNPAFFAELTLIGRCGQGLADVLKGTTNPLQLIFPEGSLATAEHLYSDSPSTRLYNVLTERALSAVLDNLPPDRPIRVLEIGAGTGGLTSYLVPALPRDQTEYVFTDLSNHFFIKAEQKFADYPFIKYKKLDIERDLAEQEFTPHSFDVVVASQVLHATADLRKTMSHVRQLLSPDGLLVLLEVAKPARWIDLVFGLTEGWWRFSDTDLRPAYPLLSFSGWEQLLRKLGFSDTVDIASAAKAEGFGSAVIFSRGPSTLDALETKDQDPAAPTVTRPIPPLLPLFVRAGYEPKAVEPGHRLIFADK